MTDQEFETERLHDEIAQLKHEVTELTEQIKRLEADKERWRYEIRRSAQLLNENRISSAFVHLDDLLGEK